MKRNQIPRRIPAILATVFFVLTLILVSCNTEVKVNTNEQNLPSKADSKAAIMKKIEIANEKWAAGDPMGFAECAAEEVSWLVEIGDEKLIQGKEAVTAFLEGMKGKVPPHEHELLDFVFQFHEDIVIINYRYQALIEESTVPPWKVTAVYKYIDGEWLAVHENWTKVKFEAET